MKSSAAHDAVDGVSTRHATLGRGGRPRKNLAVPFPERGGARPSLSGDLKNRSGWPPTIATCNGPIIAHAPARRERAASRRLTPGEIR